MARRTHERERMMGTPVEHGVDGKTAAPAERSATSQESCPTCIRIEPGPAARCQPVEPLRIPRAMDCLDRTQRGLDDGNVGPSRQQTLLFQILFGDSEPYLILWMVRHIVRCVRWRSQYRCRPVYGV